MHSHGAVGAGASRQGVGRADDPTHDGGRRGQGIEKGSHPGAQRRATGPGPRLRLIPDAVELEQAVATSAVKAHTAIAALARVRGDRLMMLLS